MDIRTQIVPAPQYRVVQQNRITVVYGDTEAEALSAFYKQFPDRTDPILRIEREGAVVASKDEWVVDEDGTLHRPTRWPKHGSVNPYGVEIRMGQEATLHPKELGAKRWEVVEVYVRMPEGCRDVVRVKLQEAVERILREEKLL